MYWQNRHKQLHLSASSPSTNYNQSSFAQLCLSHLIWKGRGGRGKWTLILPLRPLLTSLLNVDRKASKFAPPGWPLITAVKPSPASSPWVTSKKILIPTIEKLSQTMSKHTFFSLQYDIVELLESRERCLSVPQLWLKGQLCNIQTTVLKWRRTDDLTWRRKDDLIWEEQMTW